MEICGEVIYVLFFVVDDGVLSVIVVGGMMSVGKVFFGIIFIFDFVEFDSVNSFGVCIVDYM